MQELNEAEMFRSVLNEMLGELKQLHQSTKETNKTINILNEKVTGFDKRLEEIQIVPPAADLGPVEVQLAEGVSGLNQGMQEGLSGMQGVLTQHLQKLTDALEAQPKPIVRRISLFPEKDYHGNYKYFIRAFCLWTLGLFAVGLGFKLIRDRMEGYSGYQHPVYREAPYHPQEEGGATAVKPKDPKKGVHKRRTADRAGEGKSLAVDSSKAFDTGVTAVFRREDTVR